MAATQQFCTFYLQDQLFGVPVEEVQEVIRYQEMTRVPLATPAVRGLINLRGQIVMAIDLRRRMGMNDRMDSEVPMNVVVRTQEGAVSLLADRVGGVVQVDETTFERPPATVAKNLRNLIKGVHKLGLGLMHVLNTEETCSLTGTVESS